MGFLNFFKTLTPNKVLSKWKEIGVYNAVFTSFGSNAYKSSIVRSCVEPIAVHTGKANAKCSDKRIEKILNVRPNMYMTGSEFLEKTRNRLELTNTVFIYIHRDDRGRATGFYPVPCASFDAVEYMNGLYIKFYFTGNAARQLVLPWEDLAVLRKHYNSSDIAGDDASIIINDLELINVSNQGISNAVKATANLRGILKSTKAMLSDEDKQKQKETFVKDYLNLENNSGIASLDATQEFTPISMNPTVANWETMKEFRENIYRYYGVNDNIIMSNYTEAQLEAFYSAKIEPFLNKLSQALTSKVFTEREQGFDNYILYESNRLVFASMSTKVNVFKEVVLYGGMTINEWRAACDMEPIDGGDVPIRRLDAASVDETPTTDNTEEDKDD